jgi:hypothetical protein
MILFMKFLFFLSCVACVSLPSGDETVLDSHMPMMYSIDVRFPHNRASEIIKVCEEWNNALGRHVFECYVSFFPRFFRHKFLPMSDNKDFDRDGTLLGLASVSFATKQLKKITGSKVYLNLKTPRYDFKTTVRHELGHVLRLDHSSTGFMKSHMSPHEELYINEQEVRRVKEKHGWLNE